MYERFTDRARKVLELANEEARRFGHEYIGTEHLLLGLIKEDRGVGAQVLVHLGVDLPGIRAEVEKLMTRGPDTPAKGRLPQTPRAKNVIEFSMDEARNLNHDYVGTEHILLGLIREEEGVAAQILMNVGLTLEQIRGEIVKVLPQGVESRSIPEPATANLEPADSGFSASKPAAAGAGRPGSPHALARVVLAELAWCLPVSVILGVLAGSWLVFLAAWGLITLQAVFRTVR